MAAYIIDKLLTVKTDYVVEIFALIPDWNAGYDRKVEFLMCKVVVVVDMQNDFVDGSLGTAEAQAMLPRLVQKLSEARASGTTDFIFTMDTHPIEYLQTAEGKKLPVEHCIKGSSGWEIVPQLQSFAASAKAVVEKPTFGSIELPKFVADYNEIELVGLCTDICVISNALLLKAFYPEKQICVDAACCAGVTQESHKNALSAMKMCQIAILE